MADLSGSSDRELQDRLVAISRQLDALLRGLGPAFVEIGRLREESSLVLGELQQRAPRDGR